MSAEQLQLRNGIELEIVAQRMAATRTWVDPAQPKPDDVPMTDDRVPRPELDAKLQTIEARMDGKFELLVQKMDTLIEQGRTTSADFRSLKTTTVVTGVSTALAIVLGIAAFNATVLSNMLASFESGKSTMAAIDAATAKIDALTARISPAPTPAAGK